MRFIIPTDARFLTRRGLRTAVACLLALFALAEWGCSGARRVEQVRRYVHAGQAATLEAAYANLLDAPSWEAVSLEPERYVKVSGRLRQDGSTFEAYYVWSGMPPQVAFFVAHGRRGTSAEFPDFLRQALLKQALAKPAP